VNAGFRHGEREAKGKRRNRSPVSPSVVLA